MSIWTISSRTPRGAVDPGDALAYVGFQVAECLARPPRTNAGLGGDFSSDPSLVKVNMQ
jgi:hypothetical protein